MTLIRISEIIHEWLGWCPNMNTRATTRHPDLSEMSAPVTPGRQGPHDDGIPRVMGDERYRNTQISIFFTAGMIVMLISCLYNSLTYLTPFGRIPAILLALLVLLGWLFTASLTVIIYNNLLEIRLGPLGLHKRKISLAEIESVSTGETPKDKAIRYSIIRADPRRIHKGVTIALVNGMRIRISSDEPEKLVRALEDAIAHAATVRTGSEPS